MLAGNARFRVQKIGFIGAEANNKEPGSAKRGYIPQFPYGIHFCVLHFRTSNISQAILSRGKHFTTLTDEGHVMVCVMPRHVPALLRIDERV
jgi:hypothetical protein